MQLKSVLLLLLLVAGLVGCSATNETQSEQESGQLAGQQREQLLSAWKNGQRDRATLIAIHNATLEPGCRDGIECLEEAFRSNPGDREVLNLLGVQYMVQGQLQASLTYLELATTEFASSEALANRARVQLRLGMASDALGSIERYENGAGTDVVAHRLRAQLELLREDLVKALEHMRAAYRLSPDPITTRELADMLVRCENHEQAADLYQALIDAGAPGAAVRGNLAFALLAIGRVEESIELAQESIAIDEGYAPAWRTLGRAQTKLKQYDEALVSLDHALGAAAGSPMVVRVHYSIGEAHLEKGNTREAVDSYWKALILLDPQGSIRANLPARGTFPLETEAELMHKHLGDYLRTRK